MWRPLTGGLRSGLRLMLKGRRSRVEGVAARTHTHLHTHTLARTHTCAHTHLHTHTLAHTHDTHLLVKGGDGRRARIERRRAPHRRRAARALTRCAHVRFKQRCDGGQTCGVEGSREKRRAAAPFGGVRGAQAHGPPFDGAAIKGAETRRLTRRDVSGRAGAAPRRMCPGAVARSISARRHACCESGPYMPHAQRRAREAAVGGQPARGAASRLAHASCSAASSAAVSAWQKPL
eukprot:7385999-Prymnesium_polylepis.1